MSTRINIAADGFIALKQQADKVARENQNTAVKKLDDQQTTAQAQRGGALPAGSKAVPTASATPSSERPSASTPNAKNSTGRPTASGSPDKQERNDVPTNELVRELSAQRFGQPLVPFAFSWRGDVEWRQPTTYEILLEENDGTPAIRPSVFTYRGGDHLTPQPFQVAAASSKVTVPQSPRFSEWITDGQISLNNLTTATWRLEGFWAEQLINTSYVDWPSSWSLPGSPGNLSPVGALSHQCTPLYLSVATDGSIFTVIKLPTEIVDTQSATIPNNDFLFPPGIGRSDVRPIWWGDPTFTAPMFLGGLQQYVFSDGVKWYNSYSLSNLSTRPSRPLHTFAFKEPYMFLKIKNGKVSSKTAYFNQYNPPNPYSLETDFVQFIAANSYGDDPGKNMRGTYAGEVRVRNGQAHKLRMRYEEVFEGNTYIWYEDFPYPSLTGFITGTGAQARLNAGVTFEDHIYNLDPYNTDAELAAQLGDIVNPTAYQDQPEYLPDKVTKITVASSFVAQASRQLSTAGADVMTPLTYFVAMP